MQETGRRRDHFDSLGLSDRDAWRARLRYVGAGDIPLEQAVELAMQKYEKARD